jgi:hypothetical protein
MNKCVICNTSEAIVYSGVDALVLRSIKLVGKICYPCGNKQAQEAKDEYAKQITWYNTLYKSRKS